MTIATHANYHAWTAKRYHAEAQRHEADAAEKRRDGRSPEGSLNAAKIMRQMGSEEAVQAANVERADSPQGVLL